MRVLLSIVFAAVGIACTALAGPRPPFDFGTITKFIPTSPPTTDAVERSDPVPPTILASSTGVTLLAAATPAVTKDAEDRKADVDKKAEVETPWGEPKVDTQSGCGSPVVPIISRHGGVATIRTKQGPLCTVDVEPAPQPVFGSLTLTLALDRPMLLGKGTVFVVLAYHAEHLKGWARGRLSAKVNDGSTFFDWLGTDQSLGEIRVPVPASSILMANELKLWLELQGMAQRKGSERLVLDAVTIQDQ